MFKQFAVVFSGDLATYFAPRYFATMDEAFEEYELCRKALKDPSEVQIMKLVPWLKY